MWDDWKVKTHGHPSSRRKMFITPTRFKLYLKSKIYFIVKLRKSLKGKNLEIYIFKSSWANQLIIFNFCRLHTAILDQPPSSAATMEVQGPDKEKV